MDRRGSPPLWGGPPGAWRGDERAITSDKAGEPSELNTTTTARLKPGAHKLATILQREKRQRAAEPFDISTADEGDEFHCGLPTFAARAGLRVQEVRRRGVPISRAVRREVVREADFHDWSQDRAERAAADEAHASETWA